MSDSTVNVSDESLRLTFRFAREARTACRPHTLSYRTLPGRSRVRHSLSVDQERKLAGSSKVEFDLGRGLDGAGVDHRIVGLAVGTRGAEVEGRLTSAFAVRNRQLRLDVDHRIDPH